jgi:hypothetical protein
VGPFCFYAFDLLWLDDSDLRHRPLSERKTLLRRLLPLPSRAVLYVEQVANGTDLFRVIYERDLEGVVAKQASARYTPEANDVGQDQEPRVQSGCRTRGFLRLPEGSRPPATRIAHVTGTDGRLPLIMAIIK